MEGHCKGKESHRGVLKLRSNAMRRNSAELNKAEKQRNSDELFG